MGVNRIEQQQSNIDKKDQQDRVPCPVHPDYPCDLNSHVLARVWGETQRGTRLLLLYLKTG